MTVPAYVERMHESRRMKAATLVGALRAGGFTAAEAVHFDRQQRAMIAQVARTRVPSNDTWRLVVSMLAGSASREALCPFCGLGDPEGVPGPAGRAGHPGVCSR